MLQVLRNILLVCARNANAAHKLQFSANWPDHKAVKSKAGLGFGLMALPLGGGGDIRHIFVDDHIGLRIGLQNRPP